MDGKRLGNELKVILLQNKKVLFTTRKKMNLPWFMCLFIMRPVVFLVFLGFVHSFEHNYLMCA